MGNDNRPKASFSVRFAAPEDVYPLRLEVLRPGGVREDAVFEGDRDADTVHFVAVGEDESVVGVVSLYRAAHPEVPAESPYQLRGMATHPSVRGAGCGKLLLLAALKYCRETGADALWCNAREGAVSFYAGAGLKTVGEPFDIPGIGPHLRMVCRLP